MIKKNNFCRLYSKSSINGLLVYFMSCIFFVLISSQTYAMPTLRQMEPGEEVVSECSTIIKIAGQTVTLSQDSGNEVEHTVANRRGFKKGDKVRVKVKIDKDGSPKVTLIKGCPAE